MPCLGQYDLLHRLGTGGAANVFLVRDLGSQPVERLLALKALRPELAENRETLAMFFSEARIASRLHHPNIAEVAGFGRIDGIYSLAMEYIFGATMAEVLAESARENAPLTVGVVLKLMAELADALHYAHELRDEDGQLMNIVHRDVSFQNIILGFDGVPKLLDFGIAKATNRGFETRTGVVKGKFAYMSPEQAMGKRLDRRSDIFCLGILLWESLTGEILFESSTPIGTLVLIREKPIPAPSEIVPELSALVDPIVMRALQRSPEDRFRTAAEMRDALLGLIDMAQIEITPQIISGELAKIYGAKISERAMALRNAVAGDVDADQLGAVLGGGPMRVSQLPAARAGDDDPDPLRLFAEAEPAAQVSTPHGVTRHAEPESGFARKSSATSERTMAASGLGAPTPEQLDVLTRLDPAEFDDPDEEDVEESWASASAQPSVPRLISMISDQDRRVGTLPQEFVDQFRAGFSSDADSEGFSTVRSVPRLTSQERMGSPPINLADSEPLGFESPAVAEALDSLAQEATPQPPRKAPERYRTSLINRREVPLLFFVLLVSMALGLALTIAYIRWQTPGG